MKSRISHCGKSWMKTQAEIICKHKKRKLLRQTRKLHERSITFNSGQNSTRRKHLFLLLKIWHIYSLRGCTHAYTHGLPCATVFTPVWAVSILSFHLMGPGESRVWAPSAFTCWAPYLTGPRKHFHQLNQPRAQNCTNVGNVVVNLFSKFISIACTTIHHDISCMYIMYFTLHSPLQRPISHTCPSPSSQPVLVCTFADAPWSTGTS